MTPKPNPTPRGLYSAPLLGCLLYGVTLSGAARTPEDVAFFESRIRPVLVSECYECHNSHTPTKGGLALDYRDGLLQGGESGPAIVPGQPDKSLLLRAIRHDSKELRMPKDGAKLSGEILRDVANWIQRGAPDPRDTPPTAEALAKEASWDTTFQQRKLWWSLQPIQNPEPPSLPDTPHPIDRHIRARLHSDRIPHSPPANRRVLIRRLTFALTGLPPTPEDIESFLRDTSPEAYSTLVDRLLESPRFGERWARHWMDWLRYADSHGSEGDPRIPEAWRYRDYLIRALNGGIPHDQMILEHLAGDLLPEPRLSTDGRLNESAFGLGHYRMVFHGFAPTDALDEQVRFTENQVDVVSKAFLGMTVACARCHNHKFDAISQADFYALYGVFASARPATITVDRPESREAANRELRDLKRSIRTELASAWMNAIEGWNHPFPDAEAWRKAVEEAATNERHSLHPWARWQAAPPNDRTADWNALQQSFRHSSERLKARSNGVYEQYWNLSGDDAHQWFLNGPGVSGGPASPGDFQVPPDGDRILGAILPGGVYSHLLSSRDSAVLHSPRFGVEGGDLWIRVMGQQDARARYVVQNYPRAGGLLYPSVKPNRDDYAWQRWDVNYWNGDQLHMEIATARDVPIEVSNQERSWFGVRELIYALPGQPEPKEEMAEHLAPLLASASPPASTEALANRYRTVLRACVKHWLEGMITDEEALFLDGFVRHQLLPTELAQVPQARPFVDTYRAIESALPLPTRAPGVMEGSVLDQPLFVRGSHKLPTNAVPRRFLEAIDSAPYPTTRSGRLELAHDIIDPDNPLTSRVIVNRIWHHLFGRGIVASTDNFGRLGDTPSHPDLLDDLATRMKARGGSLKRMIRFIVMSETYRQDFEPSPAAAAKDPDNRLLSHFPLLRLDAEAIRDAILLTSGRLDTTMYGPGVDGNSNRRSVYLRVIRNDLDPFLSTFDAPEPLTTRGRRNVTNVPGQSLALLNAPFVIDAARQWADGLLADPALTNTPQRVNALYDRALGRPARVDEIRRADDFLRDLRNAARKVRIRYELSRKAIQSFESQRAELMEPVRKRLLTKRRDGSSGGTSLPAPMLHWDFETSYTDRITGLTVEPFQGATLKEGALVLQGGAYVMSKPVTQEVSEKTLEARVMVGDLGQQGGGALTLQTANGNEFDAIVFGEQSPRQWLAGSDTFKRTQSFEGPEESASPTDAVHMVITYQADGTITAYRNGQRYGKPYRSNGPQTFKAGQSVTVLGCRHTPPVGNRLLTGRILDAKIYDRALTPEEIEAAYHDSDTYVSEADVRRELTPEDRDELATIDTTLAKLRAGLERLEKDQPGDFGPDQEWRDLAQSIFNLKEFIYIR